MQIVGTPIVAIGVKTGGLMTRRTSNRKKKYQSGRGTYVVVVGSALGPISAPNISDRKMITIMTTSAMIASFATAYGKNGLPWFFRIEYSRRYVSFSAWFTSALSYVRLLDRLGLGLDLQPRWRRRAELRDQVDVRADQGKQGAGKQQHVN